MPTYSQIVKILWHTKLPPRNPVSLSECMMTDKQMIFSTNSLGKGLYTQALPNKFLMFYSIVHWRRECSLLGNIMIIPTYQQCPTTFEVVFMKSGVTYTNKQTNKQTKWEEMVKVGHLNLQIQLTTKRTIVDSLRTLLTTQFASK